MLAFTNRKRNEGSRMLLGGRYCYLLLLITYSDAAYNQQMQRFTIYFCKTLNMFQTVFPSIITSSKLHIQRQVFVRPILLLAASLASSR